MNLKGFNIVPQKKVTAEPGYYRTKEWKKIRAYHLAVEPLCRTCAENGYTELADTVDHIIQRIEGGTDMEDNLQSLCRKCHDTKRGIEGERAMYENNPKWIRK